jgi:hypothetical protein
MRKLGLTLLLLVFSASPCLVVTGCGPSADERKQSIQEEIEDEDRYTDGAEEESGEDESEEGSAEQP